MKRVTFLGKEWRGKLYFVDVDYVNKVSYNKFQITIPMPIHAITFKNVFIV